MMGRNLRVSNNYVLRGDEEIGMDVQSRDLKK